MSDKYQFQMFVHKHDLRKPEDRDDTNPGSAVRWVFVIWCPTKGIDALFDDIVEVSDHFSLPRIAWMNGRIRLDLLREINKECNRRAWENQWRTPDLENNPYE